MKQETKSPSAPFNRALWGRFAISLRELASSEVGFNAIFLFVLLIGLMVAINTLNVFSSYVSRDFMTAISKLDQWGFVRQAVLYVSVLAAITVVAVFFRFVEERLGLLWRNWLTHRMMSQYMEKQAYYRLGLEDRLTNPDQRIADDVRVFAISTISFLLMFLNGSLAVIAFSGVLWSINPLLFGVAVAYSLVGSALSFWWGRPLIGLNYRQSDHEANFRSELIRVRENAVSVALLNREGPMLSRLHEHVDELVANLKRIIDVNRNLGFFTTGYNNLVQVIPVVIVAPLFMRGEVEFGVITQSTFAFAQLMGAFSLIVTQFQSISSYLAVVARLGALSEALDEVRRDVDTTIDIVEKEGCVAFEDLTLRSPRDGRVLVDRLNVNVPCGHQVLVLAMETTAKVALFRATAGLWASGEGRIIRPLVAEVLFIPERPYLPPGSLRALLLRTGQEGSMPDERLLAALDAFDLRKVVMRAGGLDAERNWDEILSLDEQELMLFARVILLEPRFVFIDRLGTALNARQSGHVLDVLAKQGITYVNTGDFDEAIERYDAVLEIASDGSWTWQQTGRSGGAPTAAEPTATAPIAAAPTVAVPPVV